MSDLAQAWLVRIAGPARPGSGAFTDPARARLAEGLQGLTDEILGDLDPERTCRHLDTILRVRSIQGTLPSEAVAFVFQARDLFPDRGERVDQVALWAFDLYTRCREAVMELRLRDALRGMQG